MLVVEGHRFQRKNCFARFVHRLNRILESLRRNHCTQVAIGIDDHPYASCNRYPTNAGDKCGALSSSRADADRVGITSYTTVTDIDIVIARQM